MPTTVEAPVIDTDIFPFVPEGWSVLEHRSNGKLTWNTDCSGLFVIREQYGIMPVSAIDVYKAVIDKPVLNANVLDYLIAHPELIPDGAKEWLDDDLGIAGIVFWGTIYRDENGKRRARCLSIKDGAYIWGHFDIDADGLTESNPAAMINIDDLWAE